MDLQFLLDRVPMNAYNKGYGDEVQNQLRQAQSQEAQQRAQQLIQEMMMKQEAQPVELENKRAMAADYWARAKGTGHYSKDKPIDPKKSAEAQAIYQARQYPALQAYEAEKDMARRAAIRDALLKDAEAHGDSILPSMLESDAARKAYIESMARSKEVGKLQHGREANATNITIQDKRGESNERVANIRGAWMQKAAQLKSTVKDPKDIKQLQAKYRMEMDNAKTDEEKDFWAARYNEVSGQIVTEKAAAATAAPGAKMDAAREFMNELNAPGLAARRAKNTPAGQGTKEDPYILK